MSLGGCMITSKTNINIFWKNFLHSGSPSGTLHSKKIQITLILAIEANSALSWQNGLFFRILAHCGINLNFRLDWIQLLCMVYNTKYSKNMYKIWTKFHQLKPKLQMPNRQLQCQEWIDTNILDNKYQAYLFRTELYYKRLWSMWFRQRAKQQWWQVLVYRRKWCMRSAQKVQTIADLAVITGFTHLTAASLEGKA